MLQVILTAIAVLSLASDGILKKTGKYEPPPNHPSDSEYMRQATFNQFSSSGIENLQNVAANLDDGTKYSKKLTQKIDDSRHNDRNNEEWSKYLQYQILNRMESLLNSPNPSKSRSKVPKANQAVTIIKDNESNQRPQKLMNKYPHIPLFAAVAKDSKPNTRFNARDMEATDAVVHEGDKEQLQKKEIKALNEKNGSYNPREVTYRGLESNNPWLGVLKPPKLNVLRIGGVTKQPTEENKAVSSKNKSVQSTGYSSSKPDIYKATMTIPQTNRMQKRTNYSDTTSQKTNKIMSDLKDISGEIAEFESELIANFTHRLSEHISSVIKNITKYKAQGARIAKGPKYNRREHQEEIVGGLQRDRQHNRMPSPRKVNLKEKKIDTKEKLQPERRIELEINSIAKENVNFGNTTNKIASVQRKNLQEFKAHKSSHQPRRNYHVGLDINRKLQAHRRIENVSKLFPQDSGDVVLRSKLLHNAKYSPSGLSNYKVRLTTTKNNRLQKISNGTDKNPRHHEADATAKGNVAFSDTTSQSPVIRSKVTDDFPIVADSENITPEEKLIVNYTHRLDQLISSLVKNGDEYKIKKSEKIEKSKANSDEAHFQNKVFNEKKNSERSQKITDDPGIGTPKVISRAKGSYRKQKTKQFAEREGTISSQKSTQDRKPFSKQNVANSTNDTPTNIPSLVDDANIRQKNNFSYNSSKTDTFKAEPIKMQNKKIAKASDEVNILQDTVSDVRKGNVNTSNIGSRGRDKVKNDFKANSTTTTTTEIADSEELFVNSIRSRLNEFVSTFVDNSKKKKKEKKRTNKSKDNGSVLRANTEILSRKEDPKFQKVINEGLQFEDPGNISAPKDTKGKLLEPQHEMESVAKQPFQENEDTLSRRKSEHNTYGSSRADKYKADSSKILGNRISKISAKAIMNVLEEAVSNMAQGSDASSRKIDKLGNDFNANSTGNRGISRSEEQFFRNIANGLERLILQFIQARKHTEEVPKYKGVDHQYEKINNVVNNAASNRKAQKTVRGDLSDVPNVNLRKSKLDTRKRIRPIKHNGESIHDQSSTRVVEFHKASDTDTRYKRQVDKIDEAQYEKSQQLPRSKLFANQTVVGPTSVWTRQSDTSIGTDPSENIKYNYLKEHTDRLLAHPMNEIENPFRQQTVDQTAYHRLDVTKSPSPKLRFDNENDASRYANIIRQWIRRNKFNKTQHLKYLIRAQVIDPSSIDKETAKEIERRKRTAAYNYKSNHNIKNISTQKHKQQRREISRAANRRNVIRKILRQKRKNRQLKYRKQKSKHRSRGSRCRAEDITRRKTKKKFRAATDKHKNTDQIINPKNSQRNKLKRSTNARTLHQPKRYKGKRSIDQSSCNSNHDENDKDFTDEFRKVDSSSSKSLHKNISRAKVRRTRELENRSVRRSKGKYKPAKNKAGNHKATFGSGKIKNKKKTTGEKRSNKGNARKEKKKKIVSKKTISKGLTPSGKIGNKGKSNANTEGMKNNTNPLVSQTVKKQPRKHEKQKHVAKKTSPSKDPKSKKLKKTTSEIKINAIAKGNKKSSVETTKKKTVVKGKKAKPATKSITERMRTRLKAKTANKENDKFPKNVLEKKKIGSAVSGENLKKINEKLNLNDTNPPNFLPSTHRLSSKGNITIKDNLENTNEAKQNLQNLHPKTSVGKAQTLAISSKVNVSEELKTENDEISTLNQNVFANIVNESVNTAEINETIGNETSVGNITDIDNTGKIEKINDTIGNDTNTGSITLTSKSTEIDIGNITGRNKITENTTNISIVTETNKTVGNDAIINNITVENVTTENGMNIGNVITIDETLGKQNSSNLMNNPEDGDDVSPNNNTSNNASSADTMNESSEIDRQNIVNNTTIASINSNGTIIQKPNVVHNGTNSTIKVESRIKQQLIGDTTESNLLNSTINDTPALRINIDDDDFYEEDDNGNGQNTSESKIIDANKYIKELNLGNLTQMPKETLEITDTLRTYFNVNYSNKSTQSNSLGGVETNAAPTIEHQNITEHIIDIIKENKLPSEENGTDASLVQFNETKVITSSYKTFVLKKKE